PLRAGDIFLLCSDGLWDYVTDAELGKVLDALPPRQAAEVLVNAARHRANGRGDNVSLAIVKFSEKA
ncbi:MAG: serine/threonine-protein phosphatase, partial [Burkholderiales bacterium]|nr:serine/threonine-protein phosphatase [Burkholderiales bacterium]